MHAQLEQAARFLSIITADHAIRTGAGLLLDAATHPYVDGEVDDLLDVFRSLPGLGNDRANVIGPDRGVGTVAQFDDGSPGVLAVDDRVVLVVEELPGLAELLSA